MLMDCTTSDVWVYLDPFLFIFLPRVHSMVEHARSTTNRGIAGEEIQQIIR